MPDYNPAVAAGIQVPQNNFAGTLGTVANIQAEQARTGLYTLQAAQQQRQYNGLMAVAEAWRSGKDPVSVGASYGLDPSMLNQYQTLEANRQFMASHGGQLPSGLEATASASANFARAANEKAQLSGFVAQSGQRQTEANQAQMDYRAKLGNSLLNDQSDDNWKANAVDMMSHASPDGQTRILDALIHPEKRGALASDWVSKAVAPKDVATVLNPGTNAQPGQAAVAPGFRQPGDVKAAEASAVVPAELNKDLQAKAQGSVEAIQRLTRLQDAVNAADPKSFGSVLGSETARQYQPVPSLAAEHDNLKALYTDAGSAMLKSRFGSRITNMDVTQGMKIVGGTTVQNKATALKIIENNKAEAYDTIWNGLKRGVVDKNVLAKPNSREEADALGPGAIYLAPDGSPRRNAK